MRAGVCSYNLYLHAFGFFRVMLECICCFFLLVVYAGAIISERHPFSRSLPLSFIRDARARARLQIYHHRIRRTEMRRPRCCCAPTA